MVKRRIDLLILDSNETVTVIDKLDTDSLGIIDDGGVAVDKGTIVEAASAEYLERNYTARFLIHANNEIVLPGFVDPHTHLVFDGSREEEFQLRVTGVPYMDVLRGGRGILETVKRTRQATLDALLETSGERLDTSLEEGTTTVEIKSGYGLRLQDEMKMLLTINRLKEQHPSRVVATFLGAHAMPPEQSDLESYSRSVIMEMLPSVRKSGLARFCDVFCEEGAFDAQSSLRILRAALAMGLRAKVHADEFSNSGGAAIANKIRAISADHLVHSSMKELENMRETGVTPVLLPASSHSLLIKERARAREMLAMNLPVALGTDFSPANWVVGQLTVAALAARDLRMRADEIIRGITINAARALGLEHGIGAITPGMKADINILRAPSHKWIGYAYGGGLVDKVLIGGRVVVAGGKRVR